jgi:hypothetical protein
MFGDSEERSQKFSMYYRRVADEMGCAFLDISTIIVSSRLDGIHWEAGEHLKLGQALAPRVKKLIG